MRSRKKTPLSAQHYRDLYMRAQSGDTSALAKFRRETSDLLQLANKRMDRLQADKKAASAPAYRSVQDALSDVQAARGRTGSRRFAGVRGLDSDLIFEEVKAALGFLKLETSTLSGARAVEARGREKMYEALGIDRDALSNADQRKQDAFIDRFLSTDYFSEIKKIYGGTNAISVGLEAYERGVTLSDLRGLMREYAQAEIDIFEVGEKWLSGGRNDARDRR